jgi:hypothetical protein
MSSNQDSSSVYKDLVQFLQSSRADLRLEATKAVLQVVSDRYVFLEYCLFVFELRSLSNITSTYLLMI